MQVLNGYHKSPELWRENGRVRRLGLSLDGRRVATIELQDSMRPQVVRFDRGFEGKKARLTIEETYPGDVYGDTCLTELRLEF
jgi:hypothetical protein